MQTILCSLYDSKAQRWFTPLNFRNRADALRQLETMVNEGQNEVSRWPADFTLFQIGTYEDLTGEIKPCDKVPLVVALDLKHRNPPLPLDLAAEGERTKAVPLTSKR